MPCAIHISILLRSTLLACLGLVSAAQCVEAADRIEGFTTPFKTIHIATAETGVIRQMHVSRGDTVKAGKIVAQLDDRVHAAQLAIAEKSMQFSGRLRAAKSELGIRRRRLQTLQGLIERGTARPEELERAKADAEIAEAQLRSLEEDRTLKQLEHQRAKRQLELRSITAPVDGVVLECRKNVGEFVGPNDPHLLTIVQLNPLLAVFAVPSQAARNLRVDDAAEVHLPDSGERVVGAIESISPIVDGKSGTIRVEVRLENDDRRLLSGQSSWLLLGATPPSPAGGRRRSPGSETGALDAPSPRHPVARPR